MLTDKIIKEEQRSPQAKINGYIENRLGKLTTERSWEASENREMARHSKGIKDLEWVINVTNDKRYGFIYFC